MNKIFKVIYSKTRHCYVVVSELAKSHCKTAGSHTARNKTALTAAVLLALGNIKKVGEVVERPKALSDIRGVTYIYGMFYRFGLIDVPKEVKEKKNDRGNKKQKKGREDMLEENIKFFRRL